MYRLECSKIVCMVTEVDDEFSIRVSMRASVLKSVNCDGPNESRLES